MTGVSFSQRFQRDVLKSKKLELAIRVLSESEFASAAGGSYRPF
jgi:uncharacterized protein YqfB (UPF0267 family)